MPQLILTLSLVAFWLVLSGHYNGLLLSLGAASCALVVWLAGRLRIVDAESQPHHLGRRMPGFWLWLAGETLRANWRIARCILRRDGAAPVTGPVAIPLRDDLTRATLANAITLTPGTLSLEVKDSELLVHALRPEMLSDLRAGPMVARAAGLERG